MVEGATGGIGLRAMLGEMGLTIASIGLHTVSSAAKPFASRRGTGKIRLISVKELWLQEVVKNRLVRFFKIGGEVNLADMLADEVPGRSQTSTAEPACQLAGRHSACCRCRGGVLVTVSPSSPHRIVLYPETLQNFSLIRPAWHGICVAILAQASLDAVSCQSKVTLHRSLQL